VPFEAQGKFTDQLELFKATPARVRGKSFRGANGFELSYWRLPKGIIRVQLSDGKLIDITKESAGRRGRPRLYTRVPGHEGIVQGRNLKPFLAQLTLIDQIRTLNRSVQIRLKQLDDVARTLSDVAQDDAADTEEEKAGLLTELKRLKEFLAKDEAKILELEAQNTRLRDELAAARSRSSHLAAAYKPADPASTSTRANVRLFSPDIAVKLGVPAAVVLQQLWWLLRQENCGKMLNDRKKYVFDTYPDWRRKFFPFYSVPTLERAFGLLERKRLVASLQPEGRATRRKWYTLTPEGIKLMDLASNQGSKTGNESHQNDAIRKAANCGDPFTNREISPKTTREGRGRAQNDQSREAEMPATTRRYAEEQLLGFLTRIMKPSEIVQNGGMWRARIRVSPQAIIQVIKEYERLSPQERGQIKNPAGWATNQYSIFGGKPLAPPKA